MLLWKEILQMEVIKAIQEKLRSKNFSFEQPVKWKNIVYMWGDYYYHSTNEVIAKYIFIHINETSWHIIRSEESGFVTDVIEDIYYSLNNDLRWNLYLVCVVTDETFARLDRYEKRHFENNIKYTRNYIISESMIEQRIPIGKVLMAANQHRIQYPIEEWQTQLGEDYSFCMGTFCEDSFLENLLASRSHKLSSLDEKPENIEVQELCEIELPKIFRPHLYQDDWKLPCRKFNLLFGANGTGKTSILSAIELSVTGTIYKLKKYPNDRAEQANVVLTAKKQDKRITLERPSLSQIKAREREWYNSNSKDSTAFHLNSLFHRFNYFSVDESSLFASFPPSMEDIFSRLLYGNDTLKIWDNIQIHCQECGRIIQKLKKESETINIQMHQQPPSVEKIYEYYIWDYIREYKLQISYDTSFCDIQKIVLNIQSELEKLSQYRPILKREAAEKRLQEINCELLDIKKRDIALQRKIKRLKNIPSPVETISTMLLPNWDLADRISSLEKEKEKIENNKFKLENGQEKMRKIIEFWEKMSPWTGDNPNITGDELKSHCKKIYKATSEFFQFQDYLSKLEKLKRRQEEISLQLISWKSLYAKLSQLNPPQKYAEKFIERNISQISQIFINLHTPQEFSGLKISDGEVVGVRNEEIVPLTNMSTGQRNALIFSVFFQLHLSNPTVPRFLLIDEPMAHMDPLNSLQLMDFLRELVITHDRQLFVTTKNQNIAKLFRRKFSFLNESLQEISFYRENKDSCQIVQKVYNQKQCISEKELC